MKAQVIVFMHKVQAHVQMQYKPSAIRDFLDAVMPAIPYCIDLIESAYLTTDESRIKAFRPKA